MDCKNFYHIIQDGIAYIDYGPVTMTLEARRNNAGFSEAAAAGAEAALRTFEDIARFVDLVRKPVVQIGDVHNAPAAVRAMVSSVAQLEESDFTPMAAVAGTTADAALSALIAAGADYGVVNNGGDVAFHIPDGRTLKAGIISDIASGHVTHKIEIKSQLIHGFATSGMGGRSLTKGIAKSVTALAATSSLADAAATAIANACCCSDPAIERCLAEELDYDSDIAGQTVTKSVGNISSETVIKALNEGCGRAKELIAKQMIFGAVIFVGDRGMTVSEEENEMFQVSEL